MIIGSLLCDPFLKIILKLRVEYQNQKKRGLDAVASRHEYERVSANWIEHKVPWSELYNKRELNLKHNESTIDVYDNLWGMSVKTIMDHLIEEHG